MRYHMNLLGMVLAVSLCLPVAAFALKAHPQACNACHRSGANPRTLANVCTPCHVNVAEGGFSSAKASDALNHHPDNPPDPAVSPGANGDQTSHFWGGNSTNQGAAGSASPPTTFYSSRYSISTNRVTCSICHDPHKELGTKLLRATKDNDLICQQCHIYFYIDNPQAQSTHPIGNYAAAYDAAPTPKKYKLTGDIPNNALQGITLVNGNVSCSSCHAPHFADSDSATADGLLNVTALNPGDGHLLKADGPFKTNKSVLCQTCHTYMEHGKVGNNAVASGAGDVQIGCLVCHSGHSYDATAPNFFVLRKTVDSGVAGFGSKATLYTTYPTPWATYCISCHGAVTGYTLRVHTLPADNDCKICHAHNATAYSFAQGSSGTSCSSCHGAPPRIDTVADRVDNTNPDTGYAVGSNGINYRSANQNGKDESTTPHKRHAGALNTDKAAVDYAFGSGTILSACLPCHNDKEDAVSPVSPTHDTADSNLSFQDVYFSSMATYNGVLTAPLYKKTSGGGQWACSGIYCHSNGGKRPTTGAAKVLADFKTATTPAWPLGSNNTTNIGTIVGIALECQQCHGVTVATMAVAQKSNSQTHNKHLTKFGDGKTSCYLCHSATVDSSGTIPASARDHRFSGTHVNGTPNVVFSSTAFGGDLAAGTYASGATQGTCVVYCHSDAIGGAPAIVPDWDVQGNIVCGSCHSTAAASLSTPHAKHLAIATVTCNDCHFTVSGDATLGTHTGHVDGAYTYNQTSCNNCHGYEVGETTPSWGQPMTNAYCLTCHTGATVGVVKTMTAPTKQHASTRGHNRTTNYPSGNLPGNKVCTDCHLTSITNHVNVTDGDATHLAAAAATCTTSCHGVGGSAVKDGIITHVSKACTACHDPHGDTTQANIFMIRSKSTGNFTSDATPVVFTNRGNDALPLTAVESFDEDDGASGHPGEVNADDLCATCHTAAGGSGHNNRDNTPTTGSHHQGETCMSGSCHKPHTESTGAFKSGGGNFCNDCHGNPPSLSDDRPPGKIGVHAAHTKVASDDASEDKFDCEVCHPGAASFGLSHGAVPLAAGISNTTCSNACHKSTAGDGSWTDSNGLACTACHYWGSPPNSGDNTISGKTLTGTHNKHFDKLKNCVSCHPNNGSDTMAPHIHIDDHEAWALNATNDGTVLQDLGAATPDEATVDFTAATTKYGNWNDTANTCGVATANNGLGCHATGAPTWGAAGPLACIACHSDKSTSQVNPTSGLHGVTPLVSGKQHDESFTYNAGANTADCTTCHTTAPTVTATDHQNGTLDATRGATGNTKIKFDATIGYSDAVAPTCAPSLSGCHYEQPTKLVDWKRKWHEGATSNTGACAGCHGDWVNGWNTDVQHHTNAKAQSTHGTKASKTWECMDCHGLESVTLTPYPFTISSNDWRQNAGENTTLHGNGAINVNGSGTGFIRVGAISGCPTCHINWQTDGKHAYTKTEWTLATILADAPTVTCATCHGGLTAGPNAANYWPDKAGNDGTEDNAGRHLIHMTRLAKARYNEDIPTLLTNNTAGNPGITADAKQKELCSYCHTTPGGDADHGDTVNLPAEVNAMFTLWSKAVDNASHLSGNCSSVNCHNGKATSSTTNFTWYGTGTQNCTLCHNDIASGPTGTSHQAHIGAGTAIFGKVINCGSCHGGSPTWEGDTTPDTYTVPSGTTHIDGTFSISGGSVTVAYDGSYTDAATHTLGTCNKNSCHNNGKDVAPAAYTWGTAITGTCTACHGNTDTGLAEGHDGHLLASATYGKTISCQDCHEAVSSTDMTSKTNHMGGTVTLLATGITYTGTPNSLSVTVANTWGQCSASSCHRSSPATTVNSPVWNTTASGCSTCHGSTVATLTSGRHEDHLPNAYIISKCGECHTANANNTSMAGQANHINGSVDIGGSKTLSFSTPGCTSNCHFVDSAARGDWLDANSLTCTDCHSGTFLGKANKDNTSGLHQANNALRHDDSFGAGGNCSSCHSGIVVSTNSPATHMDTTPSVNNTQFGLFGNYNTTNGNCTASCHRDINTWSRKWIGVTDATVSGGSGQAVCNNCHGQFGAWNAGTVHYRSGSSGASETKGQGHTDADPAKCEDCHGYPSAATHNSNSKIDFSGNGTAYTLTWGTNATPGWFCLQTGCHSAGAAGTEAANSSSSHTYLDSLAFPSPTRATPEKIIYVNGISTPSAACSGCHINVSGEFWPDGAVSPDRAGQHPVHVLEIAKKLYVTGSPSISQQNATCNYCHPGNTHGGADGAVPADVSRTETSGDNTPDVELGTTMKKIIGATADSAGFWRRTPGTCTNVACHAGAPFTPHWYTDTTAPGNVTLTAAAGPVPRSIKLTWTAVGDDGTLDGTAYKYDMRMGTSSAIATDFGLTTNYVQGVPTVKRMGSAQETIIHNVNPSTTYYFALRTYDRAGLYGGTANGGGYVSYAVSATPDTTAPVLTGSPTWYGLDKAQVLDTSGTVKLSWTRAEDHSMPITYDIWWSTGTITYGAPQASTKDTSFRVTGLTNGQSYNFAVRAKDAYNNTDTNTTVLQAIPQGLSTVPKTSTVYYANGSTAPVVMQTAIHTVNATTATLPAVFYGPTVFTANTDIIANSFGINVVNSNAVTTLRAELGYITGTSTFNSFVTGGTLFATDQVVPKRATKLVTFKFNGGTRLITSAMNAKLGVRISVTSGAVTSIGWGPTSKGGILSFATQPINISPTVPTVTPTVSGANVSFYWTASTDSADGVADTVHYDVYGSANGGTDGFPYVIATGLTTNATVGTPLVWDTQAAGIALAGSVSTVQVKVEAGDVINNKILSHTPSVPTNLTVNNLVDNVAPGIITNFKAETRPKQGAIALSWTSPGDDGSNNGRAASYDIRWSNAVIDTEPKFTAATPLVSEPYPDFGGNGQGYEALDLVDGTYYFAIKAVDDGAKTSPLVYTTTTTAAGPKCGICHSTPPDEGVSIGNHAKHGYTINECSNCHGNDPGTGAQTFTTAHQDGQILLGWKTATPTVGTKAGYQITYTQAGQTIYQDSSPGGFNVDTADIGNKVDDGSCGSWSTLNVSGCHGPATSASWTAAATLVCSSCHGVPSRTVDNYSHSFDDPSDDIKSAPPIDNHGYDGSGATEGERKYVGAHVAHLNSSFRMSKGDSCRLCHGSSRPGATTHADGFIDIKLDKAAAGADATWLAGVEDPNPALRTAGSCGSMSPDACHPSAATPQWDSADSFACTNCHGFAGITPSHVTDPNKLINLADNDADSGDPMPGNCTWCHVGGHPKDKKVTAITKANPAVVTTETNHNLATNDKVTIHTKTGMTEINNKTYLVTVLTPTTFSLQGSNSTAYTTFDYGTWIEGNGTGIILIQNDSRVGINYLSGGVHLKANVGARGEMSSEAELCWSCHVPNSISEWGADSAPTNVPTLPGNGNNYNFGTLSTQATTGNWIGATWTSGTTGTYGFAYKTSTIKSTHSTDPTGTSALTGTAYNYSNGGVDTVGKIRCSNCHDVHNSNKSPLAADGLDPSGAPYLRGTWKSSPYKEDGAPIVGQTYTAQATSGQPGYGYGPVPRGNPSTTQAMGGFWIDQNSGNPTAGWSYETSAGLCQLCHGTSVDALDYAPSGAENLWISATNGHANAVLGGTGTGAANIFFNGTGGRKGTGGAQVDPNPGAWMGLQNSLASSSNNYGYGPRSSDGGYLVPLQTPSKPQVLSGLIFGWGNSVDATTIEVGYHQFSCSKCHNPHASRLPKLMITNCLDVTHNTWDQTYDTLAENADWSIFNTANSSWSTMRISHLSTAQNCHRYIDINGDNTPDEKGWNKVTPW